MGSAHEGVPADVKKGSTAALAAAAAEGVGESPPMSSPARGQRGSGSSLGSSSREGSRRGGVAAGLALGLPLAPVGEGSQRGGKPTSLALGLPLATAEEAAADEGVQATAGAVALAGIQVAADALPGLVEPCTPADRDLGANGTPNAAQAAGSLPFEPPGEALRDFALLGSIAAVGSHGLDVFAY